MSENTKPNAAPATGDKPATTARDRAKAPRDYDIGCFPRPFYFSFLGSRIIVPVVCAFTRIKVKPDMEFVNHEGPIIVISNHESYLDPMITNKLTKARPANFVTASSFSGHLHGATGSSSEVRSPRSSSLSIPQPLRP